LADYRTSSARRRRPSNGNGAAAEHPGGGETAASTGSPLVSLGMRNDASAVCHVLNRQNDAAANRIEPI
jgi:hypothetical protein